MQIVEPNDGRTVNVPVVWYYAPDGAKTINTIQSFTSGQWDRDKIAPPPLLGAQPPYAGRRYSGANIWGYKGQCQIGTPEQFANGLTWEQATTPTPPPVPLCCRPVYPPPPPPPPALPCPFYPLGQTSIYEMRCYAVRPVTPGLEHAFEQTQLHQIPFIPCEFVTPAIPVNISGVCFYTMIESATTTKILLFRPPFDTVRWEGPRVDSPPTFFRQTGTYSDPDPSWLGSFINVIPSPGVLGVQTIILAGDVNGTGIIGPAGGVIPTALVPIVSPGTVGDATHVPVVTIDAAGRVTALSSVAIAGGLAIGDPISGATATSLLYVDPGGNLADLGGAVQFAGGNLAVVGIGFLVVPNPTQPVTFQQGANVASLAQVAYAIQLTDGVHTVTICDGTNAISYTPTVGGNWNFPIPTDLMVAVDRLAAWIALNFPGPTPP